jgi:hypothetical protein
MPCRPFAHDDLEVCRRVLALEVTDEVRPELVYGEVEGVHVVIWLQKWGKMADLQNGY